MFRKLFGETASTWLWLDEGDGHLPTFTIYHPELRDYPNWQEYIQAPPDLQTVFPNDEIVSRFEAIVGDTIHGTPAVWRTALEPVRVTRAPVAGQQFERLTVRLLLRGNVDYLPDPDVTINFTLQVSLTCNAANTEASLTLVSTDVYASARFDLVVEMLSLAFAPAGEALLVFGRVLAANAAKSSWQPVAERIVFRTLGVCPILQVDQDAHGNASIQFR